MPVVSDLAIELACATAPPTASKLSAASTTGCTMDGTAGTTAGSMGAWLTGGVGSSTWGVLSTGAIAGSTIAGGCGCGFCGGVNVWVLSTATAS